MDIRKDDALALLSFAEDRYGSSERITVLRNRASGLNAKPDPIVDFYLTHAKPTAKEIKPYLGRWVGELIVTRGQPIPIDMEIKVENGKGTIVSVLPWPPHDKVETEIVFVNDKGELVYGRKNRGAGLIISTGHIANDGNLKGKESLVGFTIPDDVPDEVKEMMKFTMENSNTFNLKRVK